MGNKTGEPIPSADWGEENRGLGQQIVGDEGAPPSDRPPPAGGRGSGAGPTKEGFVRPIGTHDRASDIS